MRNFSRIRWWNRRWQNCALTALILSTLISASWLTASGQEADPTQPSAALLQQLRPVPTATTNGPKPNTTETHQFELRAMIMRDGRHGVALISPSLAGESGKLFRVDLTPEMLVADQPVVEFGETSYFLHSYQSSVLRLRPADSSKIITIH